MTVDSQQLQNEDANQIKVSMANSSQKEFHLDFRRNLRVKYEYGNLWSNWTGSCTVCILITSSHWVLSIIWRLLYSRNINTMHPKHTVSCKDADADVGTVDSLALKVYWRVALASSKTISWWRRISKGALFHRISATSAPLSGAPGCLDCSLSVVTPTTLLGNKCTRSS